MYREVIDGVAEVCYIAGPMLFFDLVMVQFELHILPLKFVCSIELNRAVVLVKLCDCPLSHMHLLYVPSS